jgi:sterol 3beta-glucosyltransferase
VPVPMFADQPFWARRLHAAGLAAPPVPGGRLTAARLADALDALPPRADLADAARRMANEDGVGVAWGVLEETAGLRRS